ncbi:hypothetical protein BCR34DRAFT_480160 [Clohesyomyces aquaticus]|uniref:Uncharacterized protein n=1 Tax=Clohesyomyces aquaticus TaxID=1231657 RepID=A0A1Y1ZW99_9PLEO|nr:hypothetical protein BCR34DRAFT_480160 [Clohesyomyces aquaticus]
MSWMDSWSRPGKHAATPLPLYLTQGDSTPYCHSCGRAISARKSQAAQPVKYCSSRCRSQKPRTIDRRIEDVFAALLEGQVPKQASAPDSSTADTTPTVAAVKDKIRGSTTTREKKKAKGDPRTIVSCEEVETLVFGPRHEPDKVFGRKKNRASRAVRDEGEWKSVDMVSDPEPVSDRETGGDGDEADHLNSEYRHGAGKVRPPQSQRDVNASVGGEKGWAERSEETEEMREKRLQGQKRAEEKEMVRRAARRGVVFGFVVTAHDGRKKCEAVMNGVVVEPSFAKGDWGIRWREK